MLRHSYEFSHGLCLNNPLQVWLIGNHIYQVPPFRYINQDYEVSILVIIRKVIGGMKYLMRSLKRAVKAVGICTEENWDVNRVNSIYTMVSRRFIFKINVMFDSLSW